MRRALLIVLLAAAGRAETIDGIAAVVGRHAIAWSDVRREARLSAYVDRRPPQAPVPDSAAGRQVLERLIELRLVRLEMEQTAFPSAGDEQRRQWLAKLGGNGEGPAAYGLREEDLLEYARRQLDLLAFIELRFKAGARVSPDEVRAHYETTLVPEMKRKGVAVPPPLDDLRRQIEEILQQQRADEMFEQWLIDQRAAVRIQVMGAEKLAGAEK